MNKRFYILGLMLFMSVMLVLSGCSSGKDPKESLQNAVAGTLKMDSYVLNNQIVLKNLAVTGPDTENAMTGSVLKMLNNAEIDISQVYQKDPMQTEATVEIKLKGDFSTTITIPLVMTKDKLYVKVPQIPFISLPDTIAGKFVELDLQELAAQQGQDFKLGALDKDKMQKLESDLASAVFGVYDSGEYFKSVAPKDASLPDDVKAKEVVQFQITNDNLKDAATLFVQQALPKVLDILSKDEYRDLLQLKQENLDKARKELESKDQSKFNQSLEDMEKYLTVHTFNVDTAIDKSNYPVYQSLDADLEFNDPDTQQNVKASFQISSKFSKINEKADFQIGIPKDAIPMDQFEKELSSFGY